MSDNSEGAIQLSTWNWVSLIVVIAGVGVGNMATVYTLHLSALDKITRLDQSWQTRTDSLASTIRSDIKRVMESIPPDWFRQMVESNKQMLREQEQRLDQIEKKLLELRAKE